MSDELINPSKLIEYRTQLDIIQRTADQIVKDFEIFGENITFSGKPETAYEELADQIEPIVRKLLNNNDSRFVSLLYRIDVNDEKVKNVISGGESAVHQITHLILEREFQKVVTKAYFSNKVV